MGFREVKVYDGEFPNDQQIISGDPTQPPFPKEIWLEQMRPGEFAVRFRDGKTGLPIKDGWLAWTGIAIAGFVPSLLGFYAKARIAARRRLKRVRASIGPEEWTKYEALNHMFGTANPEERKDFWRQRRNLKKQSGKSTRSDRTAVALIFESLLEKYEAPGSSVSSRQALQAFL
jgi:hypothetical protein